MVLYAVSKPHERSQTKTQSFLFCEDFMIWIIFTAVGMILTIYAYRKRHLLSAYTAEEVTAFARFFGTDFGVALAGSLTLAAILGFVLLQAPARAASQNSKQLEAQKRLYYDLGYVLAAKVAAKAKKGKALVIMPNFHPRLKVLQNSITEGVKEGLKGTGVSFGQAFLVPAKHQVAGLPIEFASQTLWLRTKSLDVIARLYPDCNVILSFVDIDPDFLNGALGAQIKSRKRFLGVAGSDVYMFAKPIQFGLITEYIIPHPALSFREIGKTLAWEQLFFNNCFLEINASNVVKMTKVYPQLFYLERKIQ
ncbi:MAG: hypothetical protein D6820_02065 [Lentisphaerae bacterium]|nr:MAG: hypothetical protein D6820_02065 [Lentisphaerota bacterium]